MRDLSELQGPPTSKVIQAVPAGKGSDFEPGHADSAGADLGSYLHIHPLNVIIRMSPIYDGTSLGVFIVDTAGVGYPSEMRSIT